MRSEKKQQTQSTKCWQRHQQERENVNYFFLHESRQKINSQSSSSRVLFRILSGSSKRDFLKFKAFCCRFSLLPSMPDASADCCNTNLAFIFWFYFSVQKLFQ